MKKTNRAVSRMLLCGAMMLAMAFTADVSAQAIKEGKAVVKKIKGTAWQSEGTSQKIPLKEGDVLVTGRAVHTDPDSNVDLYLGKNGPILRVASSSILVFEKLAMGETPAGTVTETLLELRKGRILGYADKLVGDSKYEVKTPAGIAGIRGTKFDISADGIITVISGTVIFAFINPANGEIDTKTIRAGESFRPGVPVVNAPPEILAAIEEAIDQARRTGTGEPQEPVVLTASEEPHVSSRAGENASEGEGE